MVALILSGMLFTSAGVTGAEPKAEAAILGLEDQRIQAMIAGDLTTLDRILADDLTYTHTSGKTETKREFLERLKSGDLKYKAMHRQQIRVRVLGDAAIVTGRAAVEVQSDGRDSSFPIRFVDIYVKKADRWELVVWQSTRIQ